MQQEHKGWHSRGYLPHFDSPELVQSVTFRLADSLPMNKVREWQELLKSRDDPALWKAVEEALDAQHGACFLHEEAIATCVQNALLHFDQNRYHLLSWVIMPNHVHALIEPGVGYPLSEILHSWKSYSSKKSNFLLQRNGQFWQGDYFDRFIRSPHHFEFALNYIHWNPVKAGLVARPEDWRWSSAFRG